MVYSANVPPTGAIVSESPFVRSLEVIGMMPDWKVMAAVTNGTNYIRDLADLYLPQEPREDNDAWQARIDRSVLSPYTSRLIETAAGAVLRKPIHIEGDPYWSEVAEDIDGIGSSINEYARRALDLAEERAMGRRPYFVHVDAPQIWGWRKDDTNRLTQIRIHDYEYRPLNDFGEEQVEVMRVIYPGRYDLYTLGHETVTFEESNGFSLDTIPVVPIYSNRRGVLISQPGLLDIANLNITHYQRQSDLIHALHIAAMPTLVLEGYSQDSSEATIGVNYALGMEPGHKAYYVQSDATSFEAQMAELQSLEAQMSTLGITKLFGQKFVAESAEAKRIDQAQSNSVLAIISQELESSLNQAFKLAAQYVGMEPPVITIDRDFDYYRLIGQDVAVLAQLNESGKISDETLLKILQHGEILPEDVKIADELERIAEMDAVEDLAETQQPDQPDESDQVDDTPENPALIK